MPSDAEPREATGGRERTYALLSALYSSPPPPVLVGSLLKGTLAGELGCDPSSPAGAELVAATDAGRGWAGSENELTAEYTRLFVLPGGVRPYESVFLDPGERLGGRISIGVGRFYDYAGAKLTSACTELPDHIGVEMEFMKFLCGLETQWRAGEDGGGLRRCLDIQEEFLVDHLLRWYEPFCKRVISETTQPFFRALAHLTLEFLGGERGFVPQLNQEAGKGRR